MLTTRQLAHLFCEALWRARVARQNRKVAVSKQFWRFPPPSPGLSPLYRTSRISPEPYRLVSTHAERISASRHARKATTAHYFRIIWGLFLSKFTRSRPVVRCDRHEFDRFPLPRNEKCRVDDVVIDFSPAVSRYRCTSWRKNISLSNNSKKSK